MNEHERAKTELEVTTLRMFSVFFAVLAVFVLVGTYWALDKRSTTVISIGSGVALFAVAWISRFAASRIARKLDSPARGDSA